MGYYRLSPYVIPFREPGCEDVRPGTTFDDVLGLYVFDRKLRLLVMDALERVEVALRAAVTDHMSSSTGDAFWYTSVEHFKRRDAHEEFLRRVRTLCDAQLRQGEVAGGALAHPSALEHDLTVYGEPELPPSWLMAELLTLGELEKVVANLDRRSDLTAIAAPLGLTAPLLGSWVRSFVRVRNVCAHHGRLWNVVLGVSPALPKNPGIAWLQDPAVMLEGDRRQRLYVVLVATQSVLATISPGSSWATRLSDLLDTHPHVPIRGMGFPERWSEDPFWASRIRR
ncbi:hypothetical protein MOPEL_011_00370 [Mobilicoccus pelagius NBRC 104925]|uniref:Abi family protein n=2 Tax=Mobilicoccus TaxID=984996 RepID=H5UNZ7_9MICO|nr:hypothetical protein MOPEL_011_00370 [Mobilicoccus pelagius NBRC 104925]